MTAVTARRLTLAGLLLQLCPLAGALLGLYSLWTVLGSMGPADDLGSSSAKISHGLRLLSLARFVTLPPGLVGLVLLAIGLVDGSFRPRWAWRWSCLACIPWLLLPLLGALLGLAGLVALFAVRRQFAAPARPA